MSHTKVTTPTELNKDDNYHSFGACFFVLVCRWDINFNEVLSMFLKTLGMHSRRPPVCQRPLSYNVRKRTDMSAQRRLWSDCASAQSDQSLRCPYEETLHPLISKLRPLKSLSRLWECTLSRNVRKRAFRHVWLRLFSARKRAFRHVQLRWFSSQKHAFRHVRLRWFSARKHACRHVRLRWYSARKHACRHVRLRWFSALKLNSDLQTCAAAVIQRPKKWTYAAAMIQRPKTCLQTCVAAMIQRPKTCQQTCAAVMIQRPKTCIQTCAAAMIQRPKTCLQICAAAMIQRPKTCIQTCAAAMISARKRAIRHMRLRWLSAQKRAYRHVRLRWSSVRKRAFWHVRLRWFSVRKRAFRHVRLRWFSIRKRAFRHVRLRWSAPENVLSDICGCGDSDMIWIIGPAHVWRHNFGCCCSLVHGTVHSFLGNLQQARSRRACSSWRRGTKVAGQVSFPERRSHCAVFSSVLDSTCPKSDTCWFPQPWHRGRRIIRFKDYSTWKGWY